MPEKNNANIGFEKQIWDAACVLWGHIPAAEYRKVIIGLIFLRYVSTAFERRYNELVEEAKTTSIRELKEKLQASNVEAGLRNKQISFLFKLYADQANLVRDIITQVQQEFGYENPNQAFEHIVTEWASEHLNTSGLTNENPNEG